MTPATLNVRVAARQSSGQDIVLLDLVSADGSVLPSFEAGAHIDVHLPGDMVRQYSLCSDPSDGSHYRIGVLQDPASRGGSMAVHQHLQPGVVVAIGAPRNLFPLDSGSAKVYLFGGGIGVTPMVAMAHTLQKSGRDFAFHYSARSSERAALLAELQAAPFADKLALHFDEAAAPNPADPASILRAAPADAQVYVCGPKGYMDWIIATAREQGIPNERIHFEYFQAEVAKGGERFVVVAQASGKEVSVAPDESIAQALLRLGIRVQVSCEQGICGTCLCNVVAGTPDHRDAYQTDEEKAANDQITVCCSRSHSERLVLDI
jgi:vanillate O-demethylase ferredoxin subunit